MTYLIKNLRIGPMRITEEEKAKNRAKIVATASRLFRERGIQNVGIADLMREAGFTHGGFYNHFASKEALAAEVCSASLAQDEAFAGALLGPDADETWRSFVGEYLSTTHRDDPASGCTTSALIGDVAHEPREVQCRVASGAEAVIDLVGRYFARRYRLDDEGGRRRAIEVWTQMLGALSLSRATVRADRELADEILAVAREKLTR